MTKERRADIAVIGGGLGGCAAALAAARAGKRVVLTEETAWIGGQLTSQAVPPDEHPWIERFGCTRSYRELREAIRGYYRDRFPLTERARAEARLNPGSGNVSRICHEPRAALAALRGMLAPYVHAGRLTVLTEHVPVSAETDGDVVRSVRVRSKRTGDETVIAASYVLDATECGDLLPMTGTEYVTGAESARETGEPHALAGAADPSDMQAITYCFAMDFIPGADHTIARPAMYEFWRGYKPIFWPYPLLGWTVPLPWSMEPHHKTLFLQPGDNEWISLWLYRRILDRGHFVPGLYESDVTLVNWPQNDYWLGPVIDVAEAGRARHLEAAKQLSLSLLYWMQTEAPRPDGKAGYPGLRLRPDVVGTEDGLAMAPYIRESRRIRAEFTVLEQHISADSRPGAALAEPFADSVGLGSYRLDLHPSTSGRAYVDLATLPFQLPLGCLIPVRMDNLLPACKNIGTTHVTNGCYRLHPVEWNVGEAAGLLAAFCLERQCRPRDVRADAALFEDFRSLLHAHGVETHWPATMEAEA
ncbi:MAG: FAD-dependent oxidoreductase [Paenibacillaceae bacterium]|nr:FAD-dependent oxidoreductase [Paenibacillaceae bacterium]